MTLRLNGGAMRPPHMWKSALAIAGMPAAGISHGSCTTKQRLAIMMS